MNQTTDIVNKRKLSKYELLDSGDVEYSQYFFLFLYLRRIFMKISKPKH